MLQSRMRSENPKALMTEINVTPLVDICLVLVIIFMVTTAMFLQPPFEVSLPPAHARDQAGTGPVFVAIGEDGRLAINESPVAEDRFEDAIMLRLLQSPSKRVIIRADAKVASLKVLKTLEAVKAAGAERISFGTEEVR
ncbi:MAG: biopolymer transporter ExbD [candidate division FCPU426 bacterium]